MPTGNQTQPSVDFLILADRAEAVNGKLYMMGGGWDRIQVMDFSQPLVLSMGIGIVVPWLATNVLHTLNIRLEGQDGKELASMSLGFNAGRPPHLGQAESQRIVLALGLTPRLPGPGTYVIRAIVNDDQAKQRVIYFYVTLLRPPSANVPPAR